MTRLNISEKDLLQSRNEFGGQHSLRRVAVLLASYNGEHYIAEQLDSIAAQTVAPFAILVSDDGSVDGTLKCVQAWATVNPAIPVSVIEGPRNGFAENFRHLLLNAPDDADYIAFSDQDDLWKADKLETAIYELEKIEPGIPGLFCGRTQNFTNHPSPDASGGLSPLFSKPPAFANALVQSIAGGNTMVLNRAATLLVQESVKRTGFVSHDWWCYLIVTGAGGVVRYHTEPLVHYRQHHGNLVGSNNSWTSRFARFQMLLRGRFSAWTDQNLTGLEACADLLSEPNRRAMEALRAARQFNAVSRLFAVRSLGIHRQTRAGQIGLYLAALIGKL